jgi:hypothetical protein
MTITTELTKEDAITTTELAAGYDTYTHADELSDTLVTEAYAQAEPTTTVLTTSLHCGNTES